MGTAFSQRCSPQFRSAGRPRHPFSKQVLSGLIARIGLVAILELEGGLERLKFFVAIPDEAMGRKVAPLQKTGNRDLGQRRPASRLALEISVN